MRLLIADKEELKVLKTLSIVLRAAKTPPDEVDSIAVFASVALLRTVPAAVAPAGPPREVRFGL